jgi:anti-sigma regulatory factor (Ser/Thr protein kinase)
MSVDEPDNVVERLATDADAPGVARHLALAMLARVDGAHNRADDLALVVSELVTNAVVHGPPGHLELTLTGTGHLIRIEVADAGTIPFAWPEASDVPRHGLGLVNEYSDRCGMTQTPSTMAWCELDLI